MTGKILRRRPVPSGTTRPFYSSGVQLPDTWGLAVSERIVNGLSQHTWSDEAHHKDGVNMNAPDASRWGGRQGTGRQATFPNSVG